MRQRIVQLEESFGQQVDRLEFLRDDPQFTVNGQSFVPYSTADDRADGRYRPFYETEMELSLIRGASRLVVGSFAAAQNILENLTNYTISSGFSHKVEATGDQTPDGLADAAQKVIDTFHDDNDWKADLEREIHNRSREDGEAAIVLRPRGWRTEAELIEPDCILQPAAPHELESWLGTDEQFVSSWSFGVHTREDQPWRPLGYHVTCADGYDWSYYPASNVGLAIELGTGVMELIKRNVPRNAKRGISDYYQVLRHLERAEKLVSNVEAGAAVQAAIAFIREHATGTSAASVSSFTVSRATDSYTRPLPNGATQQVNRQRLDPGSIVDTTAGTAYKAGPMGAGQSAPNFIEVIQAALRYCGSRWCLPEYMVSADASSANYASTLVAGAPFVQARQADQRFYASRFHRIDWLVLRIAFEGGYFARFGLSWEEIEAALKIDVVAPEITISNKLEQAQISRIENSAGVLSRKSWATKAGYDPAVERDNIAAEPPIQQQPVPSSGGRLIEAAAADFWRAYP